MMNLTQLLQKSKPTFDPPIEVGNAVYYRPPSFFGWMLRPRIGIILSVHEEGMYFNLEHPSRKGFKQEVISVFHVIQNYGG